MFFIYISYTPPGQGLNEHSLNEWMLAIIKLNRSKTDGSIIEGFKTVWRQLDNKARKIKVFIPFDRIMTGI